MRNKVVNKKEYKTILFFACTATNFYPMMSKNLPGQDGYFLFFRFRMATISNAMLTIRLSSSYVLIRHHSFPQDSDRVGARPPAVRVSILCCQGVPRLQSGRPNTLSGVVVIHDSNFSQHGL